MALRADGIVLAVFEARPWWIFFTRWRWQCTECDAGDRINYRTEAIASQAFVIHAADRHPRLMPMKLASLAV